MAQIQFAEAVKTANSYENLPLKKFLALKDKAKITLLSKHMLILEKNSWKDTEMKNLQ